LKRFCQDGIVLLCAIKQNVTKHVRKWIEHRTDNKQIQKAVRGKCTQTLNCLVDENQCRQSIHNTYDGE